MAFGVSAQSASAADGLFSIAIEEGGLNDAATSHMTRFHNGGSDANCYTLSSGDCSIDTLTAQNDDVWFQAPMKHCESPTQDYCIASVQIYHDGDVPTDATFEYEAYPGLPKVQPDPAHGIMETGQPLIFKSATETSTNGSSDFMIQAGIHYTLAGPDFQPQISEFKMSAFPVGVNSRDSFNVQKFQPGTRVSMQVRVPKEVGGWFKGRLGDPRISISAFDSADYLLNVDAVNVAIPYAQAFFTEAQLAAFKAENPGQFDWAQFCGNCGVGVESDGQFGFLDTLRAAANDTSPDVRTGWYLTSMKWGVSQQCEAGGEGLVGLVASNASAYTGRAPQMDSSGLKYQVASFHYLPDGQTVAQGSYDLVIRDDFARCIYNLPNSGDLQAHITVAENGTASPATTTFEDEGGFVHFSAKDFHFSAPVISAALTMAQGSKIRVGAKVSGLKRVGELLSVAPKGVPNGAKVTYSWLRAGKVISGEKAASYRLTAADLGKNIQASILVKAKGLAAVSHRSLLTLPIQLGQLKATPTPVLSGTVAVGKTAVVVAGSWDSGVNLSYAWQVDGKPLSNATGSQLALEPSYAGKTVAVTVTGSRAGYKAVSRTSASALVALGKLQLASAPKVAGVFKVGKTLLAKLPKLPSGAVVKYQWMRGSKEIAKATKATYKLVPRDKGLLIKLSLKISVPGYAAKSFVAVGGKVK